MKRLLGTAGVALVLGLCAPQARAQTGIAQGKVVDQAGQPVAEAQVEISFQGGITLKRNTKTSKKGEYIQVGLQPGIYRFTGSKEGYQPAYVETKVNLGDPTPIPEIKLLQKGASAGGGPGAPGKAPDLGPAAAAAIELVKAGKFDEAEAAFLDLIGKAAPNAALHNNLGYVYVQKKDYAKAEAQYLKVIELDPNYAEAHIQLAGVYKDQGDTAKAFQYISKAADDHPQEAKLVFTKGLYLLNDQKNDEAGVAFRKAAELDPKNAEPEYYLGILDVQLNKSADAIVHLQKYLASSPTNSQNVQTAQSLLKALKPK